MPRTKPPLPLFARRLTQFREGRNLSINALAKESGVSASVISEAERGLLTPGWDNVLKLCRALGVRPNDFE